MFSHVETFRYAALPTEQILNGSGLLDPNKTYGYVLINDLLVPYSFIERLKCQVFNKNFNYDCTFSMEEICDSEFMESLDEMERRALPACMLMLIEAGYWDAYDDNCE